MNNLPLESGYHFGYITKFDLEIGKFLYMIKMRFSTEYHSVTINYANHLSFNDPRFELLSDLEINDTMENVVIALNKHYQGRECMMDVRFEHNHDQYFNYIPRFCIL